MLWIATIESFPKIRPLELVEHCELWIKPDFNSSLSYIPTVYIPGFGFFFFESTIIIIENVILSIKSYLCS